MLAEYVGWPDSLTSLPFTVDFPDCPKMRSPESPGAMTRLAASATTSIQSAPASRIDPFRTDGKDRQEEECEPRAALDRNVVGVAAAQRAIAHLVADHALPWHNPDYGEKAHAVLTPIRPHFFPDPDRLAPRHGCRSQADGPREGTPGSICGQPPEQGSSRGAETPCRRVADTQAGPRRSPLTGRGFSRI